jgi:hypothetical protein
MAGTLQINITKSSGEIRDLRFSYIWSAWLDGVLLGKGHACKPDEVEPRVLDLVSPDDVERIEITQR